jgi:hypothetical protein
MGWVATVEHADGRKGRMNELMVREYTRVFTVETSSNLDGPDLVLFAPGLPRMYDPFVSAGGSLDAGALVREILPEPTDNLKVWRVTVRYSSDVESLLNANPLLRPAEVSYDTVGVAIPVTWDKDGLAIKNSAGEPFDPPVEMEEHRLVVRISRNLPDGVWGALAALPYCGAINSAPFLGLPAYCVKCVRLPATRLHENGKLFWKVDAEFHVRRLREPNGKDRISAAAGGGVRSWTAWLLDRGYNRLKSTGSGVVLTPVQDPVSFQPSSTPRLLDGNGGQLSPGFQPVYRGYDYLPELDFNALGLV